MINITIKTKEGKQYNGNWNCKIYNSKDENTYKIYLNNVVGQEDGTCYIISEKEKERLISQIYQSKVDENNYRINMIKNEYEKLDFEAQKTLLNYFVEISERKKALKKFSALEKTLRETTFGTKILSENEILEILEETKESIDKYFETIYYKNNQDEIKRLRFAVKNMLNNNYFVRELGKEKIEELRDKIVSEYLD